MISNTELNTEFNCCLKKKKKKNNSIQCLHYSFSGINYASVNESSGSCRGEFFFRDVACTWCIQYDLKLVVGCFRCIQGKSKPANERRKEEALSVSVF